MLMRNLGSLLVVLLALLTLVGCSASSRVVRTYDGEARDAAEVARLHKAADLEIAQIDGESQQTYLLDNSTMQYELLPGAHEVVLRYSKLWALPGSKDIGEKRAEEIESELMTLNFTAEAGGVYRLDVPQPASRDEAERIAGEPQIRLLNANGRVVANAVPWRSVELVEAFKPTSVPPGADSPSAREASAVEADAALPALEAMKILWGRASAEEKKEFLRWAFQ